jgi:WD40 repeat protein
VKTTPGHSNRVFSVKFTKNENVIISGGWDNTIQIWDIREGHAVRSIYGPHICGDALDIVNNDIVSGSWRPKDQLELWDFGSGEKITTVPWSNSSFSSVGQPACMLYTAQFSKEGHGRYIVGGGSGANEARIFDHSNNNALVGTVTGLLRGVFTSDFSPEENKVAIGGGDSCIRILDIEKKHHDDA